MNLSSSAFNVSLKPVLMLCVCALLLSACAGLSKKDSSDSNEQPSDEAAFIAIAKPVAAETPAIPKAAKTEFAAAIAAMQAQDWEDAKARLTVMSEQYPKLAGVFTNLGIVYSKLEHPEDAEQAYKTAIELNPYNFDAYSNLGLLLRNQGRFSEAEQVYLDALKLWPHHQPSLINIAVLYDLYMGKKPEALAYFKIAQQLNEQEDRKLKGWIIDLQRQVEAQK